jgi:diaminopimelate epimerase
MIISFTKMNGAGNDFVMIDNMRGGLHPGVELIQRLCDRTRGVGADGVICIEKANGVDYRMRYYNRDGREVEMCGNGARCAALFAARNGLGSADEGRGVSLSFVAEPGRMGAVVHGRRVAVSMTDATGLERSVRLDSAEGKELVHVINTGVPHAVSIEPAWPLRDEAVTVRGRGIRSHARFARAGINANFVHVGADSTVFIRTYERGVEAETLACGTGAVAASVVLSHLGVVGSPVTLATQGGEKLVVTFDLTDFGARKVVLEGPADVNFDGTIELETEE